MKINAKNTAAIKTNVKLKMQQEEGEGARVSERGRDGGSRKIIKLHLQFL